MEPPREADTFVDIITDGPLNRPRFRGGLEVTGSARCSRRARDLAGAGLDGILAGSLLFVAGFISGPPRGQRGAFGGIGTALIEHKAVVDRGTRCPDRAIRPVVPRADSRHAGRVPCSQVPRAGLAGAPMLGVVFGVGRTPCLGSTLGAVQTLAYTQAFAGRGALLRPRTALDWACRSSPPGWRSAVPWPPSAGSSATTAW